MQRKERMYREGGNFLKNISVFVFTIVVSFFISACLPLARTVNLIPSAKKSDIEFFSDEYNPEYQFYYSDTLDNLYLRDLRTNYALDSLTVKTNNQFDKVKIILNWVSNQWSHSGSNRPEKSDAISILEEAKEGQEFRCVEYGIVSAAALNSFNFPARVLGLKTYDVEKVKYGAGHVAAEVFLTEYNKWVFIDGQFNVVPILQGVPLNAVEFQNAIVNSLENLKLVNINGELSEDKKKAYLNFVSKYLYYFDISFDNRIEYSLEKNAINEYPKLTLVPLKAKNPKVFQRKYKINSLYSNSTVDFYSHPKE